MYFVELLWTLKGHSLGHSEDHVKVISYLHFILFVDILEGPSSYGCFLGEHFWGQTEFSRLVGLLPSRVFFNGKLVIHTHRNPTFWPHWLTIRGVTSYPPKVKV
jgi:hypothetical protein